MGYYVRALPQKKSEPKWKVQYVSFKKKDTKGSTAKFPKKEWDISKDRWTALGFYKYMSVEEAKVRARQLNSQLDLKRQEERIIEIEKKNEKFQKRFDSYLPEEFVAEFEKRFIRKRDSEVDKGKRRTSRAMHIWKAAQKMIVSINVEPSDWYYSIYDIYDYFHSKKYSIRYIQSIIKIANLWGFYFCKKTGRPFLQIPTPKGYERMRLIDAYYSKEQYCRKPSEPLEPDNLYTAKGQIKNEQFNWLYLTVWFGLRPQEVDNLKKKELWKIEEFNGKKVLWLFQTKIVALPYEDRWKPIPIIFEEQEFALRIVKGQNFRRPLVKTVRRYFGGGIDLYGGRKGFTDLMLAKGQELENISVWMGHSTLERTWRSYKQRRKYHLRY
ncbi:MAG: site-specific integrase [Deltaproteobacteria bacterium]|nr:MAG: site-specific integrase [Deltaproteobacteria bacterium]